MRATPQLRIRLLREQLELVDEQGVLVDLGRSNSAQRLALAAFAAAAPAPVEQEDKKLFTSEEARKVALRRACKSARLDANLATGLARAAVDLHRVLEESRRPLSECSLESVQAALGLVDSNGPCPELRRLAVYGAYRDALEELRHRARALKRRRILIVEDIIGNDLALQLSRHDCTVVDSWERFTQIPDHHAFDLALVDLHLSADIADHQGEAVRTTLKSKGVPYPIIMMTANAWKDLDVSAYADKNEVFVILKGQPGTGQVEAVIERVNSLLDDDLESEGVMLKKFRTQLVAIRAEACTLIELRKRNGDEASKKRVEMNKEWATLWLVLDQRDPGVMRTAVNRFLSRWGNFT